MTLRSELEGIRESAYDGEWDIPTLEDRIDLLTTNITPEKACFIGGVSTINALNDAIDTGVVSDSSIAQAVTSLNEVSQYGNLPERLDRCEDSLGIRRLEVARDFWHRRQAGLTDGFMFVSAESEAHALVGAHTPEKPLEFGIFDTETLQEGYDLETRLGSVLVAHTSFIEKEPPTTTDIHEFHDKKRLRRYYQPSQIDTSLRGRVAV